MFRRGSSYRFGNGEAIEGEAIAILQQMLEQVQSTKAAKRLVHTTKPLADVANYRLGIQ